MRRQIRGWTVGVLLGAVLLGAVLLGAPRAAAQPNLRTLFPKQAPIYVNNDKLSRLELPVEVLAACRADLSDVRVFDAQGNEVPYLVDSGPPPNANIEVLQRYALEIVDVTRERQDRKEGPSIFRERYELKVPPEVSPRDSWDLVVQTNHPQYVRRIGVRARSGGGESALVDDGSLFRLVSPFRERSRLPLPRFSAQSLIIAIEGEEGSYLEPVFHLESSTSVHPREQARVELREIIRRESGRQTVIELERPRGLKADSLVMATSTPAFSRAVEVWDEGPGAVESPRGGNGLYRVQAAAAVEDLTVPLKPAEGDRLRVVIENGDSPPLANLVFTAVAPRPVLLFVLPPQGENASGTLRFGGGRAYRPEYDLQWLGPLLRPPREGEQARVAEQLYEPAAARLGVIEDNPEFNPAPVLAFAMRPGGEVDARIYSHRRVVQLNPSAEGLARLSLTPEDLAQARADLADLRIVDGNSRQWAYLLELGAGHQIRALEVKGPKTEDGFSEYQLVLPVEPAVVDQIEIDTALDFFSRDYELIATREQDEFTISSGRLSRRVGDPRPVTIAVDNARIDSLKLKVHDGDDAPLKLSRVEARFPKPELYVAAPAGEYTLLLGNPEDVAPAYELAQVRGMVLAVRSSEVEPGPLGANPRFSASARLASGGGPQQVLLWVALLAAVGALSFVTLKMVRQQPQAAAPTSPPPEAPKASSDRES